MKDSDVRPILRRVTTFATTFLIAGAATMVPALAGSSTNSDSCQQSQSSGDSKTWVKQEVKIEAPPEVVWESIHEERSTDPDLAYSKVIEQLSPNEYKLEQKFAFIPIVGTSVCLMQHKEVPLQRIDYHLLHSDRFKAMEGSWVLTPLDNGRATKLELSSHLDMGLPVPKSFMHSVSSRKIALRLTHVKQMAETQAHKLAAAQSHPAE